MAALFSQEDVLEAYVEERAKEREDKKEKEMAERMLRAEEPLEKIAYYIPSLTLDELTKIKAEITQ